MNTLGKLLASVIALVLMAGLAVLVFVLVRWLWSILVNLVAPADSPSPKALPPLSSTVSSCPKVQSALPPDPVCSPPQTLSEDLELRVALMPDRGGGRNLGIEVRNGPAPSSLAPLVYVVTAISTEQSRESSLRYRSADPLSQVTFRSVNIRTSVARRQESWTTLTFIDIDTLFPSRSGLQHYTFTCQVFRPGPEIALGLPGPQGRAMETACTSVYLDLTSCGYYDLQEWVSVREDALAFFAKVLSNCVVSTQGKWNSVEVWVQKQVLPGATLLQQVHVTKRLTDCLKELRLEPLKSSNRSTALSREAPPDLQRELVAVARELVDEEPLEGVCRRTYESLREACSEALANWSNRAKEPLPPRTVTPKYTPVVTPAPETAVLPTPQPALVVAPSRIIPQVRVLTPVPVAPIVIDQEQVVQMRAILAIARVAALLGFPTTTHEQDKIIGKFRRRLVDDVRDDATRERVRAELQDYLDNNSTPIGQLSYLKRRLDAAVAPVGAYLRAQLGETMRALILARVEPSIQAAGLYGHGVRKYGWTPLPVRRTKPSKKPTPIVSPRRRSSASAQPARAKARKQAKSQSSAAIEVDYKKMPIRRLEQLVRLPAGLPRAGKLKFLKGSFFDLNNSFCNVTATDERSAIQEKLLQVTELYGRLKVGE